MTPGISKKDRAQASALAIAERLPLFQGSVSERQWTKDAGVNPSFFSNLRGTPTKPPSDPSVDQLRQVLRARGVTLSEFFLPEAEGKVMRTPTTQAVEKAFADALGRLPTRPADQPRYLAEVVAGVLGLPEGLPATQTGQDPEAADAPAEAALPRAATSGK